MIYLKVKIVVRSPYISLNSFQFASFWRFFLLANNLNLFIINIKIAQLLNNIIAFSTYIDDFFEQNNYIMSILDKI